MKKHVTEKQLLSYILYTLTDAEHEYVEAELANCVTCHARLQELQAEYRAVKKGLVASLGTLRPSSQATFTYLSSQLNKPTRSIQWPQARLALSGAVALALFAIALFVFVNYQWFVRPILTDVLRLDESVPGDVITLPSGRFLMKNAGFEAESDGVPAGWTLSGPMTQIYESRPDENDAAVGQSSALLTAADADLTQFAILEQSIAADNVLGERIRLSALVKSDGLSGWAGLFMLANGSGRQVDQFDNMYNRPIVDATDWTRYEIVLDVPEVGNNFFDRIM
ncbi:MAG: hypothetical protein GY796_00065 [Chloroflexi bacterium]|nr:hypothetical protein [Chloroflexota bacterium]